MIKELIRLATHLDAKGLRKEADYLDAVIKSAAEPEDAPAGRGQQIEFQPSTEWEPVTVREAFGENTESVLAFANSVADSVWNEEYGNMDSRRGGGIQGNRRSVALVWQEEDIVNKEWSPYWWDIRDAQGRETGPPCSWSTLFIISQDTQMVADPSLGTDLLFPATLTPKGREVFLGVKPLSHPKCGEWKSTHHQRF